MSDSADLGISIGGHPVQLVCDGEYLFVVRDGVRIARRGPQRQKVKQWTALEPGFQVFEEGNEMMIGYDPPGRAS